MDATKVWSCVKQKAIQLLGGLLMEKSEDGVYVLSLGRVSWWAAFVPAVVIWVSSKGLLSNGDVIKDISPNHLNLLYTLAGYNLSKKAVGMVSGLFGKATGTTQTQGDGPG